MDRGARTEGYRPWGYIKLNMTKPFTFTSHTDVAALVVPTLFDTARTYLAGNSKAQGHCVNTDYHRFLQLLLSD